MAIFVGKSNFKLSQNMGLCLLGVCIYYTEYNIEQLFLYFIGLLPATLLRVYTLLQQKRKFLEVTILLEKIVCHWTWDDYCQDHLRNSSRPYVRVSDPGVPGKIDIKLAFLLDRSV